MTAPRSIRVQAERDALLAELKQVNHALKRNQAVPDITIKEARALPTRDLKIVIEASSHRLAAIIAATKP